MSCDVGEATEGVVGGALLILEPVRRFTYVTVHSPRYPTLPSLHLCHSSLFNPSVASSTSQLVLQPFCRFTYVTWRATHDSTSSRAKF